jgi:DNA mismatch repair ATPase MutS
MLMPYTHIHSYLNIPDTSGRDSLFQAESRRCKDILDVITQYSDIRYRHFCTFDELYSGTNPEEASKAGFAFLEYLSGYKNVNFILTTHYLSICKKYKNSGKIQNYKMDVKVLENGHFDYTYKMKKGISTIKGALRVLKDMDYPAEIIKTIESKK